MKRGNKISTHDMLWYHTNLEVGLMFIFLDIGGEYMTRMMDIFDFLRSRGRNGKNNLGNNKIIVGLIFH